MKKINWIVFSGMLFIHLQGCDQAFEPLLTEKKLTLLAPANNLSTTDTSHTFFWETLKGADQYELQVVSPTFDSIAKLVADTIVSNNQFLITMQPGAYQWRVKAMNSSSATSFSDPWNFTIQ